MASTRKYAAAVFVALTAVVLIYITTLQFFIAKGNDRIREAKLESCRLEQVTSPSSLTTQVSIPKIPKIKTHLLRQVTFPRNTKIVILNRDRLYRQGDVLTVSVKARDAEGRPKTYGGDFFRARLSSGQKSSPGRVTDHGNGTYTVQFPLYWAGNAWIRIQLVHPSEAVKVLQRVREIPNKRNFYCTFFDVKANITETRQCFSSVNPSLPRHQRCDMSRREVNATWFCQKPKHLPCASISKCRHKGHAENSVYQEERKLFEKPYIEEELRGLPRPVRVVQSKLPTSQNLPACPGNTSEPLTHGHWSGKVWKSSVCNVRVFAKADVQRCLANKIVFMQGDSTLRQWYLRLKRVLPLFDKRRSSDNAVLQSGYNSFWNIAVRYRFHNYPIQGRAWINLSELSYTADELDANVVGGPNTVIVLSLWAHFASEPQEMFRSRMQAIRHAIHRLLYRSPGTRVFVRTGTTREHMGGALNFMLGSDWLTYQITKEIRQIFRQDEDVHVLDTWDMSVCQRDKDYIHPGPTMVDNQLNMLLSHICPK